MDELQKYHNQWKKAITKDHISYIPFQAMSTPGDSVEMAQSAGHQGVQRGAVTARGLKFFFPNAFQKQGEVVDLLNATEFVQSG